MLDIETVCESKPDIALSTGRSIVSWHQFSTVFRLLQKIILMPFQTSIFYIELAGVEYHSSEEMSVVYIGDKSNYEYVVSCLFGSEPMVCCHRRIAWWDINRQVKDARRVTDLLVGDIDFPFDLLVKKQGALILPRWLKQKVVIANTWQDVLAKLRRKTRREALRSIRKHNLKARVVRDKDSDRYFYHHLYKPYIFRRFGAQAMVVDELRFLSECANGQLLQILQDNKVLAVVLVHLSGKQLTIAWMGIDKNVLDNQLNGVTDALDMYSLMYAFTKGCDVMDMGGSRPLINDGILRYKKKWGSAVSQGLIPKGSIFYLPCRLTQAVESFLENNPMIVNKGNKLRCISWVFAKENAGVSISDIDEITALLNNMSQPGLDEFQCFQIVEEGRQQEHTGTVSGLPYRVSCIPHSKVLTALST